MTKAKLKSYQTNKRIYKKLSKEIDSLQEKLSNVKVISGQVQKSDEEYPYIMGHVQVEIADPKPADAIQKKITDKEQQRTEVREELNEVEKYIAHIDDAGDRQIFEWLYLDGLSQQEVGDIVNYTQSMISRIIDRVLKHS